MATATGQERKLYPGRWLLWLGIVLGLLGPVIYIFQLRANHLTTPWYVPMLGTIGALLIFAALVQARSVWRVLALLLIGVMAGGEWFILTRFLNLPAYTGPVHEGLALPQFSTLLVNGSSFTRDNLKSPQNTVLVIFRGRW
jgi:hypothetical protein